MRTFIGVLYSSNLQFFGDTGFKQTFKVDRSIARCVQSRQGCTRIMTAPIQYTSVAIDPRRRQVSTAIWPIHMYRAGGGLGQEDILIRPGGGLGQEDRPSYAAIAIGLARARVLKQMYTDIIANNRR